MTSLLGLPVKDAAELLSAKGKAVRLVEGGKGDDARVIKCVETENETVLYWCAFKTELDA